MGLTQYEELSMATGHKSDSILGHMLNRALDSCYPVSRGNITFFHLRGISVAQEKDLNF